MAQQLASHGPSNWFFLNINQMVKGCYMPNFRVLVSILTDIFNFVTNSATQQLSNTVKIWKIVVSKTSDHIKIKIKMPNPSQEPPVSSKATNEDLKDIDVLCTIKIKIESKKSDHRYIKDQ